jgi:hypothetical protein
MGTPAFIRVQVLSHDPENDGVYCITHGAQILPLVRRTYDHADGLRIRKPPLPVRGSWGYVFFPGGDVRNPVWMGAYHPNLVDSIPNDASDPFSDYESNFDGSWSYRHGVSGFWGQQWADNSSFVMGTSGLSLPQVYRHIVTSGQQQQRVVFNQSDRNPNPQKPFGWAYEQAVSAAVGGFTVVCSPSGDFAVSSAVSGRSLTFTFNGTTISVDASGNANINLASGKLLNITQGGAAATDFLALVSKLVSAYNNHTHGGVTAGTDNTSTPNQQWTSNTIKSTAIDISN